MPKIDNPREIIRLTADHFGMSAKCLIDAGRIRSRNRIVRSRAVAAWLMRHGLQMSLAEIGQEFGGRHHTTVMSWLDMPGIAAVTMRLAREQGIHVSWPWGEPSKEVTRDDAPECLECKGALAPCATCQLSKGEPDPDPTNGDEADEIPSPHNMPDNEREW